ATGGSPRGYRESGTSIPPGSVEARATAPTFRNDASQRRRISFRSVRLAMNLQPGHPGGRWRHHESEVGPVWDHKPPAARARQPDEGAPAPWAGAGKLDFEAVVGEVCACPRRVAC